MSISSDTDALVVNYSCPINKEGCLGPVVRKEGGKAFLICRQVAERTSAPPEVIEKCGEGLPALLFVSFMASGRSQ